MDSTTAPLCDAVFDVLANGWRRNLLSVLQDHETMTLADLADELATREHETPLPEIAPEVVKRVYLTLYHTHVPKLVNTGLITYDQEQDLVRLADAGQPIVPDLIPEANGQTPI